MWSVSSSPESIQSRGISSTGSIIVGSLNSITRIPLQILRPSRYVTNTPTSTHDTTTNSPRGSSKVCAHVVSSCIVNHYICKNHFPCQSDVVITGRNAAPSITYYIDVTRYAHVLWRNIPKASHCFAKKPLKGSSHTLLRILTICASQPHGISVLAWHDRHLLWMVTPYRSVKSTCLDARTTRTRSWRIRAFSIVCLIQ